ncbi:MAG: M23 family metallopeptidase [Treponema sp.]|jgi:murein DD-endopeptidase MepM/ murein hydrolase activator NlpD|nr:M23 family metallopeptidase [Treponema sp.]
MNHRKGILGFFFCAFLSLFCPLAEELEYTVQKGETIFSIARNFQVDQGELMRFNGISEPSKLKAGQRIKIPNTPVSVPQNQSGVQAGKAWDAPYRVVLGDTFYGLAKKFGVSQDALLKENGLSPAYVLKEGDLLRIPGQQAPSSKPPSRSAPVQSTAPAASGSKAVTDSVRWPVNAKEMTYMAGRPGVVITGERDEVVKSLTNGMVISAGPFRDYGRVAIIQVEGGYYYVYGGCETLFVKEGDKVGPGTEIGRLGIDKVSGKPLLLFLVYRSDTPIDPAKAPRA